MCCLFSSLEITLWESFWWTDRENFNFIKWKMYVYLKWHHLHLSISKCHQVCFLKDRGVRTYTHVMSWLVCANSISRIRKKLAVTQGCHPGKEFGGWGVGQEGVLLLNSLLYLLNWEPRETAIYSQTKRQTPFVGKGMGWLLLCLLFPRTPQMRMSVRPSRASVRTGAASTPAAATHASATTASPPALLRTSALVSPDHREALAAPTTTLGGLSPRCLMWNHGNC